MRIIVGMETSNQISKRFRKQGHYVLSCDLLPNDEDQTNHYQGDIFDVLDEDWDLGIFHPTCTYLTSANTYIKRGCSKYTAAEAAIYQKEAVEFFLKLVDKTKHIPKTVIENPIGIMSRHYRKPDQIIQPYQFGEDASKATCLWLKGLPLLKPTQYVEPRIVNGLNRWGNQTDSGQNRLAPSADRWKERSKTYSGIADAIAAQYGSYNKTQFELWNY